MWSDSALSARWSYAPDLTEIERFRRFLEEPTLEPAMRRLSHNMLALAASDRAIDGIVKDVGRFFAAGIAMTLHATGGLTLPRLKQFCADSGLISPGRARAILLYLRFLKYVEPVPGAKRGSAYVPTSSMRNAWSAISRAGLDAAQVMEPGLARVTSRVYEPGVVFELCRIQSENGRVIKQNVMDNAFWRVFLNRHAGTQILHALMLGAGDGGPYPPRGEIPFSLSRLARDFHVSRPHVARMLRAGEKERLLEISDGNVLRFTDEGLQHLRLLLSARLRADIWSAIRLDDELAQRESLLRTG